LISRTLLNPGIEYKPLPPMIPISACARNPPCAYLEFCRAISQTVDYTRRPRVEPAPESQLQFAYAIFAKHCVAELGCGLIHSVVVQACGIQPKHCENRS
jgi:hypothetical protein